mmetsp:Transcript_22531/g.33039  ORF Transcript_22531/g.33039 Transcript_22531/m.33039 type:complete len:89 (-) Transcript_22531:83-349(-)
MPFDIVTYFSSRADYMLSVCLREHILSSFLPSHVFFVRGPSRSGFLALSLKLYRDAFVSAAFISCPLCVFGLYVCACLNVCLYMQFLF